jgi:NitT/TauT family transport system substrate-binding protein
MSGRRGRRCWLVLVLGVAVAVAAAGPNYAQSATRLRFTLDWIPGSVHGPFFIALYKGYYKAEGLDVSIAPGKGSAEVVRQLASDTYDMGYPDINVLLEFDAKNPGKAFPELLMGYDQSPAAVFVLKSSGITTPKMLEGRTLGAAASDSNYKLFPTFARAAGFDAAKVKVKYIQPSLRESLLARHDVDAIVGQMFNEMIELKAKGVGEDQVRYFLYKDYGLDLYANGIAASRDFLRAHPDAVKAFIRATIKGVQDMVRDPALAVQTAVRFEPLLNPEIERERLTLALRCCIVTPNVRANGYGSVDMARLTREMRQVAAALDLRRIPTASQLFDASYLPPRDQRMLP